jgi:phytoene dehydrogenase-like protein
MEHHPVVIIGAGVAGLTCAKYLQDFGIPSTILEASDGVGGRVRTDKEAGFLLDRGFQVFLTSYPEAKRLLNYEALQLRLFRSGAIIRDGNQVIELKNPLKEPLAALSALTAPIGSIADKWKIVRLVSQLSKQTEAQLFSQPANSTIDFIRQYGWSEKMIRLFFRPFFGGVFLERELNTSSNFFRFVFKQFATGDAALPAKGIQAIPEQIAARLPKDCIRKEVEVLRIAGKTVYLLNGETLHATTIILAVDESAAMPLIGEAKSVTPADFQTTTCTYFTASTSPQPNRLLTIHAEDRSLVHNLCVPSDVAPAYAPDDQALLSVSTHGKVLGTDKELSEKIKKELTGWYGDQVATWKHLKTYRIPCALPKYLPQTAAPLSLRLNEHLYRCGDYTLYPSLNAAMRSGREVAEMVAGRQL